MQGFQKQQDCCLNWIWTLISMTTIQQMSIDNRLVGPNKDMKQDRQS